MRAEARGTEHRAGMTDVRVRHPSNEQFDSTTRAMVEWIVFRGDSGGCILGAMRRRTFIEATGGTMAGLFGASLADWDAAGRFAAATPVDAPYEYLNAEQVRLLDAVTAQLVPTDDTPGAREAHVVRFIDHALATFLKGRQEAFAGALKSLEAFATEWGTGGVPFLQRLAGDQIAILTDFEKKTPRVFFQIRNMTMTGMFSHPVHGGNYGRVGWKLIGYEDRYSWVPPFGYYDR